LTDSQFGNKRKVPNSGICCESFFDKILVRSGWGYPDPSPCRWGLKLRERIGFKRAAIAVARKLAVIMHTMLKTGQLFERAIGTTA